MWGHLKIIYGDLSEGFILKEEGNFPPVPSTLNLFLQTCEEIQVLECFGEIIRVYTEGKVQYNKRFA